MRLVQFLLEIERINKVEIEIPEPQTLKFLKNFASKNGQYIKSTGPILYRGNKALDVNKFYYFSGTLDRVSANTTNHYTLLLSNGLKSGNNVPKRTKSLICSTSTRTASEYGNIGVVVPLDKSKLYAVSFTSDFGNSLMYNKIFDKIGISTFEELNGELEKYGSETEIINVLVSKHVNDGTDKKFMFGIYLAMFYFDKNFVELKDDAQYFYFKNIELYQRFYEIYENELSKITCLEILNKLLTPESVKLSLVNSLSDLSTYKEKEVGFDKPAILMYKDKFEELKNAS